MGSSGDDIECEKDLTEWERKRKYSYFVFLLQAVFNGLELTIVQGTLWAYLNNLIATNESKYYYDLINASIILSPILFGSIIGQWADKTRNIKALLILFNIFIFIGTVIYILPFSPLFPLAGRFFHGFNFIIRSLVYSEMARCYPSEEVQQKIPGYLLGISLGHFVGPLINMMFYNTDIWFGKLHLKYGNTSSIALLFLSAIQIVLVSIFVSDSSKEYDLKSHETSTSEYNVVSENRRHSSSLSGFKAEIALMLLMSFHSGFGIVLYPRIIPLVIAKLRESQNTVNFIFVGFGLAEAFFTFSVAKLKLTSAELFYSGVSSVLAFAFTNVGILLLSAVSNTIVMAFILFVSTVAWAYFMATTKTFLIVTFNRFARSANQTLCESIRANITLLGRLVGAITITFVNDHFWIYTIFNVFITMVILVSLIAKRNTFMQPGPVLKH